MYYLLVNVLTTFPIIVVITTSVVLNSSKYKYLLMYIVCDIYRNYKFIDVIVNSNKYYIFLLNW